jgi:hypothetical protein
MLSTDHPTVEVMSIWDESNAKKRLTIFTVCRFFSFSGEKNGEIFFKGEFLFRQYATSLNLKILGENFLQA